MGLVVRKQVFSQRKVAHNLQDCYMGTYILQYMPHVYIFIINLVEIKVNMFHPKSLQQRTILFILMPIFLFLTIAGIFGYRAVRNLLLQQWGETALANLERTAHRVDMQLNRPKQVLLLLEGLDERDSGNGVRDFIIKRLKQEKGVVAVNVQWLDNHIGRDVHSMQRNQMMMMMDGENWHSNMGSLEISAPVYNIEHEGRTFSMVSNLSDENGKKTGRVEVVMDFDSLLAQIVKAPWWNVYEAYVVDISGNIIVSTGKNKLDGEGKDTSLFGNRGLLEQKTHTALMAKNAGTVFGPGQPPEEISGFYHLKEAPWTLVIVAPGEKILQPIIHFRLLYFLTAAACIGIILVFIRLMITQTTRSIKKISQNASDLALGIFGAPLPVTSSDEVGELTRNFNAMTSQLQKGLQLQEAMDIAREVQLTLLPQDDIIADGIELSGRSIYCDETGGDYFDFIVSEDTPGKLHILLGDVVGHGIGAALLMATLRALVRSRIHQPGTPAQMITDVNRELCLDTEESANFASLFYMDINMPAGEMVWVRAGHDPAIVYHPASETFTELKGKGVVLGLDNTCEYSSSRLTIGDEKICILIFSDGSWEVENEEQEQFGKKRLKDIIRENHHLSAKELLRCIVTAIDTFRGTIDLNDDITLVCISMDGAIFHESQRKNHE